jgi:hypothetical protein
MPLAGSGLGLLNFSSALLHLPVQVTSYNKIMHIFYFTLVEDASE